VIKTGVDVAFRSSGGTAFQAAGPATLNRSINRCINLSRPRVFFAHFSRCITDSERVQYFFAYDTCIIFTGVDTELTNKYIYSV